MGDAMGSVNTLRLLPKTFNGSHVDDERVFHTRFTTMRITSDDGLPVLSDGEIIYRDAHDLEISILPGALRVISGPKEGERPR